MRGSWTIEGNLSRGPIGGHAMHFTQSGAVAMTNNTVNGQREVLVSGGSAAWTITGNTVDGGQAGQGPRRFEFVLDAEHLTTTTRSATWAVWR